MRLRFLGDSYDIVKRSLLRWLSGVGGWAAHPMFTEAVSQEEAIAFSRLLGVELVSMEILARETDRNLYFAPARCCRDHLFLDPDTGMRLQAIRGPKAPAYIFGPELLSIASERPNRLTLVFDQSLARGQERRQLEDKLSKLSSLGLHGVAYVSHACFVLVGRDEGLVKEAFTALLVESRLPSSRFIDGARA